MCLHACDPGLSLASEVAQSLLKAPVEVDHLRGGGRNSRVYKVRSEVSILRSSNIPHAPTIRVTGSAPRWQPCG